MATMENKITEITPTTDKSAQSAATPSVSGRTSVSLDYGSCIKQAMEKAIKTFHGKGLSMEDKGIMMRTMIENAVISLNSSRKAAELSPCSVPKVLCDEAIARIIYDSYHVVKIGSAYGTSDMYIYVDDSSDPRHGIYTRIMRKDEGGAVSDFFLNLILKIQPGYVSKNATGVYDTMMAIAKHGERCTDPDLCWVHNGIYNYKTHELTPFTPDKISTCKCVTDFVDGAPDVLLEDGMYASDIIKSIANLDHTKVSLLYVICAAIRCNIKWDMMIWNYGAEGKNGKSTFTDLLRAIVGSDYCCSQGITDYEERFGLMGIIDKHVLIAADNNTRTYVKEPKALKELTGGANDYVKIERKFSAPIDYHFTGIIVMNMNEMPSFSFSPSFLRRLFPIYFDKVFTNANRKIVTDYIYRKEVREYYLWYCLTQLPKFYAFEELAINADLLSTIKQNNDSVRRFLMGINLNEIMCDPMYPDDQPFPIDCQFLMLMYKTFCAEQNETISDKLSLTSFVKRVESYIKDCPDCGFVLKRAEGSTRPRIYKGLKTDRFIVLIKQFLSGRELQTLMSKTFYKNGADYLDERSIRSTWWIEKAQTNGTANT